MRASRILPALLSCIFLLRVLVYWAMGKSNQRFDGVIVQRNSGYEFYPGVKDCSLQGTPFALIPNRGFYDMVQTTTDIKHLDRLLHARWRVSFCGNLSRIGRYDYGRKYLRELTVVYVIDFVPLDCEPNSSPLP